MPTQPGTSRSPVAFAALFLVVSLVAFSALFYVYDGSTLVQDYLPQEWSGVWPFAATDTGGGVQPSASPSATEGVSPASELRLPEGMPQDFALRLWQEQVDSQATIARLAEGEVKSLTVTDVVVRGDEAELAVTVSFTDGVTGEGSIGLRRFGGTWYAAFVRANRGGGVISATEPLPELDEVDVAALNTLVSENRESAVVTQEYVDGKVASVDVVGVQKGHDSSTISIVMNEDHEKGLANIIAIRTERDGDPMWFLARFVKTGSEPLD